MSLGVEGRDIFIDDADREKFMAALERVCAEMNVRIIAHCLMGNHYHLALQVADIPLSAVMHRLLTMYATAFNRRHDRKGHLFHARYHAKLCLTESYLLTVIRYIHQNPVRAGFVKNARDWPWSSVHRFEDDGSGEDFSGFDPWEDGEVETVSLLRTLPHNRRDLDQLGATVSERTGVHVATIRSELRLRRVLDARRMLVEEAVHEGHPLKIIAEWLRTTPSSISRYLAKIRHAQG